MLNQEKNFSKMATSIEEDKIDYDEIERELESKYGKGSKDAPYTKEQLLLDTSDEDNSSDPSQESPVKNKRKNSSSDAQSEENEVAGQVTSPTKDFDHSLQKRQNMLNELINQDSDEDSLSDDATTGDKRLHIDAKEQSISNLGFDIDKALLEQNTLELNNQTGLLGDKQTLPLLKEEESQKILTIIQNNEKNNEAIPEKVLQQANQLLSFDNKFYNVKNQLMLIDDFPNITAKLNQRDHALYGVVLCVAHIKHYMFLGNSKGVIRVFDMRNQQEMMPLKDNSGKMNNRVTSLYIDESTNLMVSGMSCGDLAVWDLAKYSCIKSLPDVHNSAVTNARFVSVEHDYSQIKIVTCEDEGTVFFLHLTKRPLIGGYSLISELLFNKRITGPSAIGVFKPSPIYKHEFCQLKHPVAFGGVDNISIITLDPIGGLHSINRPSFSRNQCIPYLDWGWGLTPSHREKTVPIFAFGWDKIIQLIYINEEGTALEVDGFYYSDKEIISLHFIADSVIFLLLENKEGRETKILYTPKFYPGSFKQLEIADKNGNQEQFSRVQSVTEHAILEVKPNEIMQVQCQTYEKCHINYTNSVNFLNQYILILGTKKIQRARMFTWREYIDFVKEKYDWLAVLKIAMEIYNGDLKGFIKLADEKEIRETQMKPHMKELLKTSIETVVYKFKHKNKDLGSAIINKQSNDYRADEIAIKVAIEFCLSINATDFLFSEIFTLFHQFNMRAKLISNLEPFLISGQFKKGIIPEDVLQEFLKFYENDKDGLYTNQRNLERIVQQIDLNQYSVGMRAGLEVFCEQHCMISALLHFQKTASLNKKGSGETDIISTMYKIQKQLKKSEKKNKEKNIGLTFTKADLYIMNIMDSQQKYEIERSYVYIGYKLLWIMKMYLEGRQFPYGSSLTQELFKRHTQKIAEYIDNKEFMMDMLDFDAECFLLVIQKIFYGEPYWIIDRVKIQTESGQNLTPVELLVKIQQYVEVMADNQLEKMKEGGLELKQETPIMNIFYSFILNVHVNHHSYFSKMTKDKQQQNQRQGSKYTTTYDWSSVHLLKIDPQLIYTSIVKSLVSICDKISGADISQLAEELNNNKQIQEQEQLIMQALKDFTDLTNQQVSNLIDTLESYTDKRWEFQSLFLKLRIYLYERCNNFIESFKLHLQDFSSDKEETIFKWINEKFTELESKQDNESVKHFGELKELVACNMRKLIEINDDMTVQLIERWFDDTYSDKLIVKELTQFPVLQFNFLMKYLHFNEISIKITINEAGYQNKPEKFREMEKYTSYLCLFVELMCKINLSNPSLVDEQLIEAFVKKDYYPIEQCLEICAKYRQDRAIAVLLERNQNLEGAIETTMNFVKKQSLIKLLKELVELIRFHQLQMRSKKRQVDEKRVAEPVDSLIRLFGERYDFEECYKHKALHAFDSGLIRAVDLAKKAYNQHGEGVFFSILYGLNDMLGVLNIRLRDECRYYKSDYEQLLKNSLQLTHEDLCALLEDFILKRKNAILMKHVPYNISPDTLLTKLNLDLRSIRKVFDYRVKAIKSEKKLIKMANQIILKEIMEQYLDRERLEQQGYVLEGDPEARKQYTNVALISKDVCDFCGHDIISQRVHALAPVCVFIGCAHTYHSYCLNIFYKEQSKDELRHISQDKCPKCFSEGAHNLDQLLEANSVKERRQAVRRSQALTAEQHEQEFSEEQRRTELNEDFIQRRNAIREEQEELAFSNSLDYSNYNRMTTLGEDLNMDPNSSQSLKILELEQFDKCTFTGSLKSEDFLQY